MRFKDFVRLVKHNRRELIYRLGEQHKFILPVTLSKILSVGNGSEHSVPLMTYDGSGQACHPSIAVFRGETYLACTPYPYGVEYYENPCLYKRDFSGEWKPIPTMFPLVRPERLGYEHYSDPCLFQREGRLYLIYRKCERRHTGKVDQLYISSSSNGTDWDVPRLLAEGKKDSFISPAVADNGLELFCIEYNRNCSRLVSYSFDDISMLKDKIELSVRGGKEESVDFFIWHIDIRYEEDGSIRGLFMMVEREPQPWKLYRLSLYRYNPGERVWELERILEKNTPRSVYKSAFMDKPGRILCTETDKKGRWYLYEEEL